MNDLPYFYKFSDNQSFSLYASASGKSVRKKKINTFFPQNNFFTLHFVTEGEAIYIQKDQSYKIYPNSLIVIYPGQLCELKVLKAPYVNYWLNIKGIDIAHILANTNINLINPVVRMKENLSPLFESIHLIQGPEYYRQIQMLSLVYNILSLIIKESADNKKPNYKEYYISSFVDYIESNYGNGIRISDIANHIGISCCQLYRVINDEFGISPLQFLSEYRIKMSKILLKKEENLKISSIAKLCGFTDPLYFSRVFLKHNGVSPSVYRNQIKKEGAPAN